MPNQASNLLKTRFGGGVVPLEIDLDFGIFVLT